MDRRLICPLIGILAAIAITTTMDANDLSMFSALPLLPLGQDPRPRKLWPRFSFRNVRLLSWSWREGTRRG